MLESDSGLIERLWDNTRFFKAGLAALGLDTGRSESPITPVVVGDAALAMKLSDRLFELGCSRRASAHRAQAKRGTNHRQRDAYAGRPHLRARRIRHRGRRLGLSRVMSVLPPPRSGRALLQDPHPGLSTADLSRLFTRDAPDAYRAFSRGIDSRELQKLPWHRRLVRTTRCCSWRSRSAHPARRLIYGISLMATLSV